MIRNDYTIWDEYSLKRELALLEKVKYFPTLFSIFKNYLILAFYVICNIALFLQDSETMAFIKFNGVTTLGFVFLCTMYCLDLLIRKIRIRKELRSR